VVGVVEDIEFPLLGRAEIAKGTLERGFRVRDRPIRVRIRRGERRAVVR
jgi:hypothetical protein